MKMVSFSATVIGINTARRPNGSTAVALALGLPLPPRAEKAERGGPALHIAIPGQQPPTHENRVIIFFTEEEWAKLEHKPTYGEEYVVRSTKKGFEIILED